MPAPAGVYDKLSCSQAQNQRRIIQASVTELETSQRAAATGDAIGVFLVLVPVSTIIECFWNGAWKEVASCSIRKDFSDETRVCEIALGLCRIATMAAVKGGA